VSIAGWPSPWLPVAAVCLAAAYVLLAIEYRSAERTWVGSTIVLLALAHTLGVNYTGLVERSPGARESDRNGPGGNGDQPGSRGTVVLKNSGVQRNEFHCR